MNRNLRITVCTALIALMSSCFTGVESTPRIGAADVRKQQAANLTAEQQFLTQVHPLPPAQWQAGREFLVANDRISLIFNTSSDNTEHLNGHKIYFKGFAPARSLTGDDATDAMFVSDDNRNLVYRISGTDSEKIDTLKSLQVPFTVDLDVVDQIDNLLRGKELYICTNAWYHPQNRQAIYGLRHVSVIVDSVGPGDDNFVAAVYFSLKDTKEYGPMRGMLLMSLGTKSTRTFDNLFSFTNPRKKYPDIKDEIWQLIIKSRVKPGMTRDECRLALGTPPQIERVPTTIGMREKWTYTDGVFLIFDDGFLTRYRL